MSWPAPDKLCQNAGNPVGKPSDMDLTGFVMEDKLDGFRLLTHIDTTVTPYTRTGKPQSGKLPYIEQVLSTLPPGTWLDGELVYFDDKGFPVWGEVQSCMGSNAGDPTGKLTYVIFDCLSYAGLDIRPLPLTDRRQTIIALLEHLGEHHKSDATAYLTAEEGWPIQLATQVPASHAYHDAIIARGMEGTIVKDPTKPYASGKRGQGWTKFKATDEMDVVIMDFKPGENSFTGMVGALIFGQYKNGVLVERGRCSGMDMKMRKWFTDNQATAKGMVVSVAYMGIMGETLRHPQWKRNRIDKKAEECVWS
jgi:DNA ligase-1